MSVKTPSTEVEPINDVTVRKARGTAGKGMERRSLGRSRAAYQLGVAGTRAECYYWMMARVTRGVALGANDAMARVGSSFIVFVCLVSAAVPASAQQGQAPQLALNPFTEVERTQQTTREYNPAVPQGCDAVEQGYCIQITKEFDVEGPPDSPSASGAAATSQPSNGPEVAAFSNLGPVRTDNAFFANTNPRDDWAFGPVSGVRVKGSLGKIGDGSLSYFANATVNNVRFDQFDTLNEDSARFLVQLTYKRGPWSLTGAVSPGWTYSEGYDQFKIGVTPITVGLKRKYTHGKLSITPSVNLGRIESTLERAEQSIAGGGISLGYKIAAKHSLSFGWASAYRMYDEKVGGSDRDDWRHGLNASYEWTLNDNLTTGVSVSFARNDSSISGASWSRFDVVPLFNVSMKLGKRP